MLTNQETMKQAVFNKHILLITTATIFSILGVALLFNSSAATGDNTLEPENGTISAPASVISDTNASGAKAVKFAVTSSSSCAASPPNVMDGPDPWGGCWPGPSNTGVPTGTQLTAYTGPCTISGANVTIDSKTINCPEVIVGMTTNLIIKNSKVNGIVYADEGNTGSVLIQDSEVNAGTTSLGAVSYDNITILRSNIYGGQHNVQCTLNCKVSDSWLHDSVVYGSTHNNAFISNGGSDFLIEHSTLHCNRQPNTQGGGCSADVSFFGDFAGISRATVDKSLFGGNSTGSSYCLYGGYSTKTYGGLANNIKITNNVFQRGSNNQCGESGPVTSYLKPDGSYPPGNVWSGNVWANGGVVLPSP